MARQEGMRYANKKLSNDRKFRSEETSRDRMKNIFTSLLGLRDRERERVNGIQAELCPPLKASSHCEIPLIDVLLYAQKLLHIRFRMQLKPFTIVSVGKIQAETKWLIWCV